PPRPGVDPRGREVADGGVTATRLAPIHRRRGSRVPADLVDLVPAMTEVTVEQAMQMALAQHQAGRLAEAEALYRRVLAVVPDHAGALHLLGVLACETGHPGAAIDLIGRAIVLNPGIPEYHCNLGESCRRAGDQDGAIASFRRAVELDPGLAEAHNNL